MEEIQRYVRNGVILEQQELHPVGQLMGFDVELLRDAHRRKAHQHSKRANSKPSSQPAVSMRPVVLVVARATLNLRISHASRKSSRSSSREGTPVSTAMIRGLCVDAASWIGFDSWQQSQ